MEYTQSGITIYIYKYLLIIYTKKCEAEILIIPDEDNNYTRIINYYYRMHDVEILVVFHITKMANINTMYLFIIAI
jgi:hypothetical protein